MMLKPAACVVGSMWLLLGSIGFCEEDPAESAAELKDAPLTIEASTVGRFASGVSWHLKIDSTGRAELTIKTYPKPTTKRFDVPGDRMADFRKALSEERFFELAADYGERVPDGSVQTLMVKVGDKVNTVRIHFLMNCVRSDKAKLREPSRAMRLLVMLRGWFDDSQAADLRKYDQMVLDAAKKQADP